MKNYLCAAAVASFNPFKTARDAVKTGLTALTLVIASTGLAKAATLDFTEVGFEALSVGINAYGDPVVTSMRKTVDGITFMISEIDNPDTGYPGGINRRAASAFFSGGLSFYAQGAPILGITADASVTWTSLTGTNLGYTSYSAPNYGPHGIDWYDGTASLSLVDGGVTLEAGQAFVFDASFFEYTDDGGTLTSLGFTASASQTPIDPIGSPPVSEVPLPASGVLLLAGLTGMAAWRKRRAA